MLNRIIDWLNAVIRKTFGFMFGVLFGLFAIRLLIDLIQSF